MSPIVGLAFINVSTSEAVLCQLCDSQSYVRTINKIGVFEPTKLLLMDSLSAQQSQLCGIIQENLPDMILTYVDRRYWSDKLGYDYVDRLAFPDELVATRALLDGHYFAMCSLAAVSPVTQWFDASAYCV